MNIQFNGNACRCKIQNPRLFLLGLENLLSFLLGIEVYVHQKKSILTAEFSYILPEINKFRI